MLHYINEIIQDEKYSDHFRATMGRLKLTIESFSDGTSRRSFTAYQALLDIKKQELSELKSRSAGLITSDEYNQIGELEDEIGRIQTELKNASLERTPLRAGVPDEGILKGESVIQKFSQMAGSESDMQYLKREFTRLSEIEPNNLTHVDSLRLEEITRLLRMERFYDSFILHTAETGIKGEIKSNPYIALDPAGKGESRVYVEAQLLSSDPEFITNPAGKARILANVRMQAENMARFNETGELPLEIVEELNRSTDIDLSSLTTEAKGLALKNREETRAIQRILRGGTDPRRIPQLVNRVRNLFDSRAFREKDGVVSVLLPDSSRIKLATDLIPTGFIPPELNPVEVMNAAGVRKKFHQVDYTLRGKIMQIRADAAATYKAALGTFDMDDSGLPSMFTFRDADGRTRITMQTMRDPKGSQEMIFQRPKLHDAETLKRTLGADNENIIRQAQMTRSSSANFDELIDLMSGINGMDPDKSRNTMQLALDVLTSDLDQSALDARMKTIATTLEDQQFALETAVRVVREGMFGKDALGLSSRVALPSMRESLLHQLVDSGSASLRGQDVIDKTDPMGRPVGFTQSLSPEKGAPYPYANYQELPRVPDRVDPEKVDHVYELTNNSYAQYGARRGLSADELSIVTKETPAGEALRRELGINLVSARAAARDAIENFKRYVDADSLSDAENSIGVSINRISPANFLSNQLEDNRKEIGLRARPHHWCDEIC